MFANEARWIGSRLAGYAAEWLSPLLNIGSSTRDFREHVQPWMTAEIFAPLASRGVAIVHLDARRGDGIDINADLLDDTDFGSLQSRRYRALLCCNVLEHVVDPAEFARRCLQLIVPGGLLIVTVPHSYPHHSDPIDTLFRPTPEALAALFSGASIETAAIIDVGESYRDEVRRRPWILLRHLLRLPVPFLGIEKWHRSMSKPYWLFHNYKVSAVVLRRRA